MRVESAHDSSTRAQEWLSAVMGLAALALVGALTLLALDNVGREARVPQDGTVRGELVLVSTGAEALARLEQTGMKGAYLVQCGATPAFAQVDFTSAVSTDSIRPDKVYPFDLADVQSHYVQNLRSDNYMLVAVRTGVARKVDHVVPPQLFGVIRESALLDPSPDITARQDSVRINLQGEVRHILPRLPDTRESFALMVNASYFSQVMPEVLADDLRPYLAQISYIAVSEDEDDPSVDDAMRERTQQFVELITGGPQ